MPLAIERNAAVSEVVCFPIQSLDKSVEVGVYSLNEVGVYTLNNRPQHEAPGNKPHRHYFIPRSLVLRSIVYSLILKRRNWL